MEALEVVVVGAGIGGLTAAIALQRDGHDVRVVEQARELRPMGAGISLWSNGVKVLNALGLGPDIAAVGGAMRRVAHHGHDGTALCAFSLEPLVERVGQAPYPVRRADLQALLLGALGPERVTLGERCARVDDDGDDARGRGRVTTEAGTVLEADLLVAADGTHSRLRTHVVGHDVGRHYVGYHNWNGIVPDGLGEPDAWTMYVGESKRVSSMPVRDGHYFFFDVPTGDPSLSGRPPREVLAEAFAGWPGPVLGLVEALDPAGVANVSIHTHEPLATLARGRVALLGDSAHTTAPDLGQGGCQAMEDALVLARYLRTTNLGVADALRRYSDERAPRTADVVRRARQRAELSHGHDPAATAAWYDELATEDGSRIIDGICRTIESGPLR